MLSAMGLALTPALKAAVAEVAAAAAAGSTAAATPAAAAAPPAPPPPPPPGGRAGGSLSIKAAKPKPSGGGGGDGTAAAPPLRPDRAVTNCLACGRVYDLRAAPRPGSLAMLTSNPASSYPTGSSPADVAALIASGGACQAPGCGGRVALRRGQVVEGVGGGEEAASTAAGLVRDRLVAADRAGAAAGSGRSLTAVMDDDGRASLADIEANVWLTAAEKEELKAEVAAAAAAEDDARRRRALCVTLDLAGRAVVVEDAPAAAPAVHAAVAPARPPRAAADITALTAALAPWRLEEGGGVGSGGWEEDGNDASTAVGACPTLPVPRPRFGLPAPVEAGRWGGGAEEEEESDRPFVPGYAPPSDEEKGGGGGRRRRKGKGAGG